MTKYVAIDVETTGLDPKTSRIVEFAAVDLTPFMAKGTSPGKATVDSLSTLLDPEMMMPAKATAINGLTDSDLIGQPKFRDKAQEILSFLDGATLVAHNAPFDKKFLVAEFKRFGIEFKPRTQCTLKMAKQMIPDLDSYALEHLNERYSLHQGKAHRALDDAIAAGKLFLLLQSNHANQMGATSSTRNPATRAKGKSSTVKNKTQAKQYKKWIVYGLVLLIALYITGNSK